MSDPKLIRVVRPFVETGFAIQWLVPRTKKPFEKEWAKAPPKTLDELRETHRPNNNVSVRPGRYSQFEDDSFLLVFDLDIRVPEEEADAWRELYRRFPNLDDYTVGIVQSGSGGPSRHLYVLCERAFSSRTIAHSAGQYVDEKGHKHWNWEIEVFGTGKHLAMPPSIHPDSGKPYVWLKEPNLDLIAEGFLPVMPADEVSAQLSEDYIEEAMEAGDDAALLRAASQSPPIGLSEDEIREVIFALPLDDWCETREGWYKVGMALHHEFQGTEDGFEMWCEFSEQSGKFDRDDQRRVWESFDDMRSETITMRSLQRVVVDEGLQFQACLNAVQKETKYRRALKVAAKYDLMASEQSIVVSALIEKAKDEDMNLGQNTVKKDLSDERKRYEAANKDTSTSQISIEKWIAEETLRVFFAKGRHIMYLAQVPWVYKGGVWRMSDHGFTRACVLQVVEKLMDGARGAPEALTERIQESTRTDYLSALVNSCATTLSIMVTESVADDPLGLMDDSDTSSMNTLDGELWFDEDGQYELRPHDPDHRFTNQLEAEFEPSAACPTWDSTLDLVFRDTKDPEGMKRHIHEVMGYLIQTERSWAVWVLMYGGGSNGKTTVTEVLRRLMGAGSSVSIDMDDLGSDPHARTALVGKLMALDDDYTENKMLPSGQLKKLSEKKMLTANPKGTARFDFVSRATPVILSNHWPRTKDNSFGFTRRAMIFDFNTQIEEHEKDYKAKNRIIDHELSGVLNKLVAGWSRAKARGHFKPPVDCEDAKREWMGNRNTLASFMANHVAVTGSPADEVKATDAWNAFKAWCSENNTPNNYGRNTFYAHLESMDGVVKAERRQVVFFQGASLVCVDEDEEAHLQDSTTKTVNPLDLLSPIDDADGPLFDDV